MVSSTTNGSEGNSNLVIIDYNDIINPPSPDPSSKSYASVSFIEEAFGSNESSLGILAIRNIPGFVEAKQQFLPKAHRLAHFPQSYLEENLTDGPSLYNAGWSHGKEKMGDKPDLAKGSFYYNPISDTPGSEEDRAKYPVSYPCSKFKLCADVEIDGDIDADLSHHNQVKSLYELILIFFMSCTMCTVN